MGKETGDRLSVWRIPVFRDGCKKQGQPAIGQAFLQVNDDFIENNKIVWKARRPVRTHPPAGGCQRGRSRPRALRPEPGFERELMTSRDRGIGYAVFLGKKNLKAEQLAETADDRDIRIAPMLRGAGLGGIFQVIAGVALIAVACIITGGMPLASMMAFNLGIMPGILSNIGFMLMMSGITQMLSPQPKGLSHGTAPPTNPPTPSTAWSIRPRRVARYRWDTAG